jgi:hypothetical protein
MTDANQLHSQCVPKPLKQYQLRSSKRDAYSNVWNLTAMSVNAHTTGGIHI